MENEIQEESVRQEETSAPVTAEQPHTATQQPAQEETVCTRPEPVPVTESTRW